MLKKSMGPTMKRSTSPEAEPAENKRADIKMGPEEISQAFQPKIWDPSYQHELATAVQQSQPYRWGTFSELFDDTLLRQVRKEVLEEIHFTKKETDIYKVYQLGDLANLLGLDWNDLLRLPSLYKLRAAIYSQQFRDAVLAVTGCGKLLGVKTDMSINTYRKGCHLLTHDDVIGSRRVLFILYMPEPDKQWKASYGGALRLFPAIVPNVPHTDFSAKFVPQFNQMAFFTVQPGLLFHDVEEVRVDRHRLLIQGWFHIPQPGEDGFIPGEQEATEARLTLQQLQLKELQDYDFPKPWRYDLLPEATALIPGAFSDADLAYLAQYINPVLLRPANLEAMQKQFVEESIVELTDFLHPTVAERVRKALRAAEVDVETPPTAAEIAAPWKCAIPPHKQRFMYIDGKAPFETSEAGIEFVNRVGPQQFPNFEMVATSNGADSELVDVAKFITSLAFKKWLAQVTALVTTSEQVLVRRFRPGHDFILATPTDRELARGLEVNALLEATLNLTPTAYNDKTWALGEFGGYELCMARPEEFEEDDDPAVYQQLLGDDLVLYLSQCSWNSLTLMLRDPTVLKFVKYVSINARGLRWDVSCQWNVKDTDEKDEKEEGEEEKKEEKE